MRVREKRRRSLVTSFHILILILIPTEFLRASSAWHRTPTNPSHTRGCLEVSKISALVASRLVQCLGNAKFVSLMYKHTPMPPFCYGIVYIQPAVDEDGKLAMILVARARKEEWGWRSERCGRRDLCDSQQLILCSVSVNFFCVCFSEQCLMGSNP